MPTPVILSDAQAKIVLKDEWPIRSRKNWLMPNAKGSWMRAAPLDGVAPLPYLTPPGAATLTTHPDGLYAHMPTASAVDVIAIEVCCNLQNFNDKRSRYTPSSGNSQLVIPLTWLEASVTVQQGARRVIWDASGWFTSKPLGDLTVTIRHLRVLFVLTDSDYQSFGRNHLPAAHEFFCKHRQLHQYQSAEMQDLIKGMAQFRHFCTKP